MADGDERRNRPGYRDWRTGLVGIALLLLLAVVFINVPDYGPHIAIAVGVVFLVWRFATAKRRD
ncbi:hypothetical protein [Saccharopolyspora dendranthemae]|uniref:Uncharacterized protein n=1 Tax=Saccharopolyspora dendranthemae TaxID=1181886 RepID=A0A561V9R7_9PSEU|nr:hypothetical protein [Saccharopolyspora dendranthemae]TWG08330.1 hypothetical protein FHU35_11949 [Saccharopolyspora dendranthemae]